MISSTTSRKTMATLLLAVGIQSVPAQAATGPDSRAARATGLLEEALESDGGSGIVAAVMKDGTLLFSGAVGHADLENRQAMTGDTRMRVGSVSKIVTASLAARLVDAGKLDPDADIHELVPEFPRKKLEGDSLITPRMLGDHTSGIRHYDFGKQHEANNQKYFPNLVAALPMFADDPLLFEPGARHHYSSFGFNLLGIAAGRAAGSDFPTAVRRELTEPLGLEDTLPDHPRAIIPRRADFYTVFSGRLVNTLWRDSSDYYPSGGMLTSPEDLVDLTHAVFEGEFLGKGGRELLLEETSSEEGKTGYSFGWQVKRDADGSVHYEHGGETNGAYGWVYYDPESELIIAGATNYNVYPAEAEAAFFSRAMPGLRKLYGGPNPAP